MKVATIAALLALLTATALAIVAGVLVTPASAAGDPASFLGLVTLLTWPAIVPSAFIAGYLARAYVSPRTSDWSLGRWLATGAALGMATGACALPLSRLLIDLWRGGSLRLAPSLGAPNLFAALGGAATGMMVGAYCRRVSWPAATRRAAL
ncbi:MAG: hypothetical protein ABI880_07505 [Acidobacteriota bacterium]